MKIIRYANAQGAVGYAAQSDGQPARRIRGELFGRYEITNEPADVRKLLAPLVPSTILCIGLNYRQHAEETGAAIPTVPVLFLKPPTALQNPGDPILIPTRQRSDRVDYECELAVVIGKTGKNIARADALGHVLGYTCANDVSARDWQKDGGAGQWCRGKSFDTFAPLGPCLVTADEILDPNALRIQTRLNGAVMQDSNTSDMIFDVPALIEYLSRSMTLAAGTVILTGTPSGVGMARQPPVYLQPGDTVTIEIEQIGQLTNPVALEPEG